MSTKPHPIKTTPIAPRPEFAMQVMVITVTRNSTRFVAEISDLPTNAIVRMEGQHWLSESRI